MCLQVKTRKVSNASRKILLYDNKRSEYLGFTVTDIPTGRNVSFYRSNVSARQKDLPGIKGRMRFLNAFTEKRAVATTAKTTIPEQVDSEWLEKYYFG